MNLLVIAMIVAYLPFFVWVYKQARHDWEESKK